MRAIESYQGQKVVVIGLGKSGTAAAKRFHAAGAAVTVNDQKTREESPEADALEALGIKVICGHHPEDLPSEDVQLLVKNPGIPYHVKPVKRALELGIEVVSEVEVASLDTDLPVIGITGSNGKTTTTTLIGLIMDEAGLRPLVCGNIGRPLTDAVTEANEVRNDPEKAYNWLVAELSSFQLKGTSTFRPRIGCMTNLYETHLDYHGDMTDYAESKWKLFERMGDQEIAVWNAEQPLTREWQQRGLPATVRLFSAVSAVENGVGVENGNLVWYRAGMPPQKLLALDEIGIPGQHNVENAAAAAAVSLAAGATAEAVAAVLKRFRGVEHRLEFVRETRGIRVFNDSKATNPQASIRAIGSFGQPVVLVAGGLDRGSDYLELVPYFQKHIKALITFGQTADKLRRVAEQAGIGRIQQIALEENGGLEAMVGRAVEAAFAEAEAGDVVLLSPACASWDQFPSYEVRGRMFKAAVHNL